MDTSKNYQFINGLSAQVAEEKLKTVPAFSWSLHTYSIK